MIHEPVVVIGAGIGGLSTAICLARAGFPVRILERARELRPIGGAIVLRPRAVDALTRMEVDLAPGIESGVIRVTRVHGASGWLLKEWVSPGPEGRTLFAARSSLQAALLATLRTHRLEPELGSAVASVNQVATGAEVVLEDGRRIAAPLVIGADGVESNVRRSMGLPMTKHFAGYVQWRCIAPVSVEESAKVEWWGAGIRFGMGPIARNRIQWYLSLSVSDPEFGKDLARGGDLLDRVQHWDSRVSDLVRRTAGSPLIWNSIYERPFTGEGVSGPVGLVGDAFHFMTPDLGLGGELAIEDAQCLVESIRTLGPRPAALQEYARIRGRQLQSIIGRSSAMGNVAQWKNPVIALLRNVGIRATPDAMWTRMIRKGYGYDDDRTLKASP